MIGDSAVAQMRGNFKNTIPYINRFVGLTSDCQEQIDEEGKYISNKITFGKDKKLNFTIANKGEMLELVPEQLYSAYLKKLKKLFATEEDKVDVVLSVPPYFSTIERLALLDACKVANVNCLRLINENTAIALCYGFFRRKEFSEKAKNIAFLDMGHGKTTCTIASFTDKKVTILSHASNRNLGGRNFDYLLCDIIGGEFNKKFGCDPRKAPKARLRMLDQIEKIRKMLSANSEAVLNIECLLEDEDLHQAYTREEFEKLIDPNIQELKKVMIEALEKSKLKTSAIDCIELVGEATRTPIVKRLAEEVFEKEKHQRTINSSECVARGCSLMAAMILPQYHVPPFEIKESNPHPINVSWSVSDGKMKSQTLFPAGNNFPSVKSLTFDGRSEPMDVGIAYTSKDEIIEGIPQLLARYKIEPPKPKEEKFGLKLRVQLDQNCIPALDTAEQIEEYIEIKKIPIKQDAPKAAKTEKKEGEGEGEGAKKEDKKEPEYQYEEKEVKKTRSTQIHFKYEHHGYGAQQIEDFIKVEAEMTKQDNVILEYKVLKNNVETYVYDMRAALDTVGNYKEFILDADRETFLSSLNATEEFIYDDDHTPDTLHQRFDELKKIGEPIKARAKFHEFFPLRMSDFENHINNFFSQAANIPEDSHITKEEVTELMKACEDNKNWIATCTENISTLPKHEDPAFDLAEIEHKKNALIDLGTKILTKPEPKKEEPKKEEGAEKKDDKKGDASAPAPEDAKEGEDAKMDDAN
uniref:Heat shock protein 70 n=1 Tax=Euplotes crassus TaxID=5936 RepID=A0A7S3KTH2_EUPCR